MAYVKLEDVLNIIKEQNCNNTGIIQHIKQHCHTADVIEVKRGKWKIKRDEYDCEYMVCSCCKEEFYPSDADTVDTTPNYCMNCGAKMDGGKGNEQ